MIVGYARVSSQNQNLEPQIAELQARGCEKIFSDTISGVKTQTALNECLQFIRNGDCLIVTRLDRLGRNLSNLISLMSELRNREVEFISIHDSFDTSSPTGRMVFHFFGALAEYERELIRERIKSGQVHARKRGKTNGRPRSLTPQKIKQLQTLYDNKEISLNEICTTFGIAKSTIYRYIKKSQPKE